MPLTDDAKAEIAAAIAIVREDRFERYARERLDKHLPPAPVDPPKDPLITPDPPKDPVKDPVTPPPAKDPKDPVEPPKATKSKYWGEILDD